MCCFFFDKRIHFQFVHELVQFQWINAGTEVQIEGLRPIRSRGRGLRLGPQSLSQQPIDDALHGGAGSLPPLLDLDRDIRLDRQCRPHESIIASNYVSILMLRGRRGAPGTSYQRSSHPAAVQATIGSPSQAASGERKRRRAVLDSDHSISIE